MTAAIPKNSNYYILQVMKIRKEQMTVFTEQQEKIFRGRLEEILLQDYPDDCEELGDDLGIVIDLGLKQARSYGIIREKDIGLYFDVMFCLAYNFDTNPDYPWARQILEDGNLSGTQKVERVAKVAEKVLERLESDDAKPSAD